MKHLALILLAILFVACTSKQVTDSGDEYTRVTVRGVIRLQTVDLRALTLRKDSLTLVHMLELIREQSAGSVPLRRVSYILYLDSAGIGNIYNPYEWAGDTVTVEGLQLVKPTDGSENPELASYSAPVLGELVLSSPISITPKDRMQTIHGIWQWRGTNYMNLASQFWWWYPQNWGYPGSSQTRQPGVFAFDRGIAILNQRGEYLDGSVWGADSLSLTGRYVDGALYIPDSLLPGTVAPQQISGRVQLMQRQAYPQDSCLVLFPTGNESDSMLLVRPGWYRYPDSNEVLPTTWTGWPAENGGMFPNSFGLCDDIHKVLVVQ